jgi:hypothetical protein
MMELAQFGVFLGFVLLAWALIYHSTCPHDWRVVATTRTAPKILSDFHLACLDNDERRRAVLGSTSVLLSCPICGRCREKTMDGLPDKEQE